MDIVVVAEEMGGLDMERRTLGMLPGFLVIAVMGEVVIEETAIIGEEITYSLLLFGGCLPDGHDGAVLHRFAPPIPFFNRLLAGL